MKKGFTLIELLAVIIILGIISSIVFPVISKQIKSAKNKLHDEQINEIIKTSKLYTVNNTSLLPSEESYLKIHLSTLINEGYIDYKVLDPINQEEMTGCVIVKYSQEYNQYEYQYSEECVLDNNTPVINTISITEDKDFDKELSSYIDVIYGLDGGTLKCFNGEVEITNIKELEVGNYNLKCEAKGENGKSITKNINTVINTKPNTPVLLTNMIPIKYENNNWIYADKNINNWYSYSNKMWANAVVLKNGITKNIGDIIEEEDIALWYVWIPRYKYIIFNGNNEGVEKQVIDITFESNTSTTGTVMCHDAINQTNSDGNLISEICIDSTQTNNKIVNNTSTYTHPSFCFGTKNEDGTCNGEELTGFWFGKFEISGTEDNITVIPNAQPLVEKHISKFFSIVQGISGSYEIKGDSHMAKNMEWGAVAYLKQSKYGLGLTDIGINNNIENKTGCGAEHGSSQSTTCNEYNTESGMLASTTGNIYGVYDVSGGVGEYTMGNEVNENGELDWFTVTLETKYYDIYTYNGNDGLAHSKGKLGDATKETLVTPNCHSCCWNGGSTSFPHFTNRFFSRGGAVDVFAFGCGNGGAGNWTVRAVLIKNS